MTLGPQRNRPTFYEFFAGGGMARAALVPRWECLFANDIDPMKARAYRANWGDHDLFESDIRWVDASDLPGIADLAWASFPCQDLSLAGGNRGLGTACAANPTRSGTFWPFWSLMRSLRDEERSPRLVVLENVTGLITSRNGEDFATLCKVLSAGGYVFGGLIIDAKHFLPQSRPRIFIVAVHESLSIPDTLRLAEPMPAWVSRSLTRAVDRLPEDVRGRWAWWRLPLPSPRRQSFADLIEDVPTGTDWHSSSDTAYLLSLMTPVNREKVERAKLTGRREVGGVYRRTRPGPNGERCQRAEVRFDDVAGCLRTPAGGSSRQTILVVEGKKVRSRLLSSREAARLMGLPDSYQLPQRYNDAYHLAGDGVCVPVVEHLARHLLEPLLSANSVAPSLAA